MTKKEKILAAGLGVFFLGGGGLLLKGQASLKETLERLEKEVACEKAALDSHQKELALCKAYEKRVKNWRARGVFEKEKQKELPQKVAALLEKHHLTLVSFSSETGGQIKFSGVLDLDVFHFLEDLKETAPGLIQENSLAIERCDERENEPKIQGEIHFDLVTFTLPR